MIGYGRVLVAAAAYDPDTGIALFPIPRSAPALKAGKQRLDASAADFQEAKNVDSVGDDLLPNTAFASGPLAIVNSPTVSWIVPEISECTAKRTRMVVIADSTWPCAPSGYSRGEAIAPVGAEPQDLREDWTARHGDGRYTRAQRHRREGVRPAQSIVRVCSSAARVRWRGPGDSSGIGEATAQSSRAGRHCGSWRDGRAARAARGGWR